MNRRRLLQALGVVGAMGVATAGSSVLLRRNRYYAGPISDHFDGDCFFNPDGDEPRGFIDLLRWQIGEPRAEWPETYPSPYRDRPPSRVEGSALRIAYVGHATFLVQTSRRNLLVDPVWSERASPVSFAGPRRVYVEVRELVRGLGAHVARS